MRLTAKSNRSSGCIRLVKRRRKMTVLITEIDRCESAKVWKQLLVDRRGEILISAWQQVPNAWIEIRELVCGRRHLRADAPLANQSKAEIVTRIAFEIERIESLFFIRNQDRQVGKAEATANGAVLINGVDVSGRIPACVGQSDRIQ